MNSDQVSPGNGMPVHAIIVISPDCIPLFGLPDNCLILKIGIVQTYDTPSHRIEYYFISKCPSFISFPSILHFRSFTDILINAKVCLCNFIKLKIFFSFLSEIKNSPHIFGSPYDGSKEDNILTNTQLLEQNFKLRHCSTLHC